MINNEMMALGKKSSIIRELFEYAKKRKAEIGEENVFDFTIGNPSIPAPDKVGEVINRLVTERDAVALHGYTSAQGDMQVRTTIANSIKSRFGVNAAAEYIYMTCGAAASLTITLNALTNEGDEVIVLAPFFPEYKVFISKAGAKSVEVLCREEDFQIDFSALERELTPKTKAIIVNSPNNPTGVVLSAETLTEL